MADADPGRIYSQLAAYFQDTLEAIRTEDWTTARQKLQALSDLRSLLPETDNWFDDPAWFPDVPPSPDAESIYAQVQVDLLRDNFAEAIEKLEALIETDNTQVEAAAMLKDIDNRTRLVDEFYQDLAGQVYQQGEAHLRARRWTDALTCFSHLQKTDNPSPEVEVRAETARRRINLPLVTGRRESYFPGFMPWLRDDAAGPLTFFGVVLLILALFNLTQPLTPQAEGPQSQIAGPQPQADATIEVRRVPLAPALAVSSVPDFPCRVVASTVKLYRGPGEPYGSDASNLARNARLKAIGRNVEASWIEVQVEGRSKSGWVQTNSGEIACAIQVATLPLGHVPSVQPPFPTLTNETGSSRAAVPVNCVIYNPAMLQLTRVADGDWLLSDGQQYLQTFDDRFSAEVGFLRAKQYNGLCFTERSNGLDFLDNLITVDR